MKPSLPARLAKGVTAHFRLRFGEWLTTGLLLQFGWILWAPPPVFETSPNFAVMAQLLPEEHWGAICLVVGIVHLSALIVNGTFPRFRFSPHLRALASFAAVGVWFSIVWAIWASGVGGTGFGTYRLVLAAELFNLAMAARDAGKGDARHKVGHASA